MPIKLNDKSRRNCFSELLQHVPDELLQLVPVDADQAK